MQTTLSALFQSTITGVVVWGFGSSSVAVAHEGYLVESRRPLWFGSPQANRRLYKYTEQSPLAAVSSRTLTISLRLASRASLSSPFPSPCYVGSHNSAFLSCWSNLLSNEQHAIWKYCIAHKWGMMYIYGIRTYQTYIHIYRQFSVFTTSVGLAALAPIIITSRMRCIVGRA